MKNNTLIIGVILVILNTIIGLVMSSYSNFNMVFADVSILTSTGMVYYLFQSSFADGFKIGLSFFLSITGVARFVCALFSSNQFEDNIAVIVFMCFIAIEAISYFAAKYLSSK